MSTNFSNSASQTHRAMHGATKSPKTVKGKIATHQRGTELSIEGTVDKVFFDTGMPSVNVLSATGGLYVKLPFPGGIIDPDTGYLHGDFIQPREGQKVIIAYANGDLNTPYISELIFRAGFGKDAKLYKEFNEDYEEDDIIRSHKSGGIQKFSDEKIETKFNEKIDTTGKGGVEQTPDGVKLGQGNGVGGFQPVALVQENMVMTALGLQPILLSLSRVGPLAVSVKG